jgi:hypothetical protein
MKSKKQRKNKSNFSRKIKRSRSQKYKKIGGITNPFLSRSSNSFMNKPDCSKMDVDMIKDMKELHTRYQKCCPKNMLGFKNSSPICKKMETNFNQLWKEENNARGYAGYDKPPTDTL